MSAGSNAISNGSGVVGRLLSVIERVGNRLPDPLTLFVILAAIVPVISAMVSAAGWSVSHPGIPDALIAFADEPARDKFIAAETKGRLTYLAPLKLDLKIQYDLTKPVNETCVVTGKVVDATITYPARQYEAQNLLSRSWIRRMFTDAVTNFTSFPPLGIVLVAMIGIGVAERSGLVTTLLKLIVVMVPRGVVSAAVVFAGVMSSMAADVGYVVLVPLGAVVFAGMGRHPLTGLAAAFAGVSAGFSANLIPTLLDPLLAGFSTPAAQLLDPTYVVGVQANLYFMITSVFLLTALGWWVTERIVEPRLGAWRDDAVDPADAAASSLTTIAPAERFAARWALGGFLAVGLVVAVLAMPGVDILRDPTSPDKKLDPLIHSLVPIMLVAFLVPGLIYGLLTKRITNDRVVAQMTAETMNTMGVYIVLAFAAAQFVAYFQWSNLGLMLAIGGADVLRTIGLDGVPLILAFILVTMCVNLFIGSASAKWAIMAPVFVPMLMAMGISPEMTQAAYRVGDSVTNIITPLMPYFPIVVAFGQKYDKNLGLGTLVSAMLPYSIVFAVGWTILLMTWYLLGLPLGPDSPVIYSPATGG